MCLCTSNDKSVNRMHKCKCRKLCRLLTHVTAHPGLAPSQPLKTNVYSHTRIYCRTVKEHVIRASLCHITCEVTFLLVFTPCLTLQHDALMTRFCRVSRTERIKEQSHAKPIAPFGSSIIQKNWKKMTEIWGHTHSSWIEGLCEPSRIRGGNVTGATESTEPLYKYADRVKYLYCTVCFSLTAHNAHIDPTSSRNIVTEENVNGRKTLWIHFCISQKYFVSRIF